MRSTLHWANKELGLGDPQNVSSISARLEGEGVVYDIGSEVFVHFLAATAEQIASLVINYGHRPFAASEVLVTSLIQTSIKMPLSQAASTAEQIDQLVAKFQSGYGVARAQQVAREAPLFEATPDAATFEVRAAPAASAQADRLHKAGVRRPGEE